MIIADGPSFQALLVNVPGVGGVVVLAELAAPALARAARHAPPVPEVGEDEVPVLDHHTRGCGMLLSGSFEGPAPLDQCLYRVLGNLSWSLKFTIDIYCSVAFFRL